MTTWDILLSAAATDGACSSLKSRAPQPSKKKQKSKDQVPSSEQNSFVSTNRFAAFYVDGGGDDDPDELDVAGAGSSVATGKPAKGKKLKSLHTVLPTTIIPDEGQIEEEFWFAIQSFLQELQRVRNEVRRYWEDYKRDESHLIMATFGTRMAIDLIRRSEIELGLQVKRPARFPEQKYPVSTFPALLVAANESTEGSSFGAGQDFDAPLDSFVRVSSRQNDLTLYNIYSTIKRWSYLWRDKPGYNMDPSLILDGEVRRLVEKLTQICGCTYQRPPYEDDITKGVKKALECGEIPIWTTFAMKLLLDMEDILYDCPMLPWMDASKHTLKHAESPLTHWHHELGRRHTPLSDEITDHDIRKGETIKHTPSLADQSRSMLERIRTSEGPRKKGTARKRRTNKKASNSAKTDEKSSSCDTYLRCGYDWYEKDVDRAVSWVTDMEHGKECFLRRFETLKINPLHCGLMKYDLYRARLV